MEGEFNEIDGAIALAHDPEWWSSAKTDDLDLYRLVEYRWDDKWIGDPRLGELESSLDTTTYKYWGMPADDFSEGRVPQSVLDQALPTLQAEAGADTHIGAYAETVVRGIHDADARLADLGLNSTSIAYGTNPEINADVRRILSAEGAAATLRVVDEINRPGQVSDPALLKMVWDLNAHPWDSGPLRERALDQVSATVGAYSDRLKSPSAERMNYVLEERVPEERRGIHTVSDRLAIDNDREALRARVAANKPAAAPQAGGKLAASTRAAAAVGNVAPRSEQPSMRGSGRYAASRDASPRAATRGVER